MLLANKNLRVDEADAGGFGVSEFDPMSVLSNNRVEGDLNEVKEPPIEELLMARTLWPES